MRESHKLTEKETSKTIFLYKKGFNSLQISKRVQISRSAVYSTLRKAGYGQKERFKRRKIYKAKDLYLKEMKSSDQISRILEIPKTSIINYLEKEGISRRKQPSYAVNHNFFDKIGESQAWLLGWIVTDGFTSDDRGDVIIGLCNKDREVLKKFRKLLNATYPIYDRNYFKRNGIASIFRIHSRPIVHRLRALGLPQKKGQENYSLPKFPRNIEIAFLRGLIEGDGCLLKNKRDHVGFSFINSCRILVERFLNFYKDFSGNKTTIHTVLPKGRGDLRKRPSFYFSVTGNKPYHFLKLLYSDTKGMHLERKKKTFEKLEKIYERKNHLEKWDKHEIGKLTDYYSKRPFTIKEFQKNILPNRTFSSIISKAIKMSLARDVKDNYFLPGTSFHKPKRLKC